MSEDNFKNAFGSAIGRLGGFTTALVAVYVVNNINTAMSILIFIALYDIILGSGGITYAVKRVFSHILLKSAGLLEDNSGNGGTTHTGQPVKGHNNSEPEET